ncbi:MAG: aminotransferase class V-fold PLP-dependent enzyme, partial [Gammaproteobacteria bacterium]|nr:aminotransferase class V-fold PLP-dependent enzyme [Gammaproteobacteria bacterium]
MTTLGRRQFIAGAGAFAAALPSTTFAVGDGAQSAKTGIFPASVRAAFPSVSRETYLNSAAMHPVGTFAADAVKQLVDFRLLGPGEGRSDFGAAKQDELKKKFGALINASASEIAYAANTTDGENSVVMGLLGGSGGSGGSGNIVIDELHFTSSLYMYKELEKQGVELRIVKHKNWTIDPEDMAKAIDKNTRLVSMALVSNVNGFMHDAKAVSAIAHARGALVFADIIQAVGATPVDVKALGIDFA